MKRLVDRVVNSTDSLRELAMLYGVAVLAAAIIFSIAEEKAFGDSLWWSFVTALTVGYGDFVPVTLTGRVAAVVLMHIVPLFVIPLVVVQLLKALSGMKTSSATRSRNRSKRIWRPSKER